MSLTANHTALLLDDGRVGHRRQIEALLPWLRTSRHWVPLRAWGLGLGWRALIDPQPGRPYDVVIGCGRRAASAAAALFRAGQARLWVQLLGSGLAAQSPALRVVPSHDRIYGERVIVTTGSLAAHAGWALAAPWRGQQPHAADLSPRVAYLIGAGVDPGLVAQHWQAAQADGAQTLYVAASRRTESATRTRLQALVHGVGGRFASGLGEDDYPAMLAHADRFVVSADSINMLGEAMLSGQPVDVLASRAASRRHLQAIELYRAKGLLGGVPRAAALAALHAEPQFVAGEIERQWAIAHSGD